VTKRKLARFAEMKTFPNVIEPRFNEIFEKDYKLKGKWAKNFFGNQKPIVLELGCGKGEYTVNLAKQNPEKNYIGIDIKGARMWKGAKMALEQKVSNALFLRTRIDFILSFFAEDEIDEIWITFPDPQPKKARKRLISSMFLSRYQDFLKQKGLVNLKTDNTELFYYTEAIVRENNLTVVHRSMDVHGVNGKTPEMVRNIKTFYEQQFIHQGKAIKYLAFELDKYLKIEAPNE